MGSSMATASFVVPVLLIVFPVSVLGLFSGSASVAPAPAQQTKPPSRAFGFAVEGIKNGAASGLASASVKMMLQPFDVIKTVQQNSEARLSIAEACVDIVSKRGFMALFTGLGVTLVGSVPSMAVYFGVYQALKKIMIAWWGPKWQILAISISAALSNCIAAWVRVPAEVLKVRLQADVYSSATEGMHHMYLKGGWTSFFELRSVLVQIVRDVPYAVCCLVSYELLRALSLKWKNQAIAEKRELQNGDGAAGKEDSEPETKLGVSSMWVGGISGGLASLLTNPMDVVKTRWMVSQDRYSGIHHLLIELWRNEGAGAFFKGATARVAQKMPSNAVFFLVFEFFRALLGVV